MFLCAESLLAANLPTWAHPALTNPLTVKIIRGKSHSLRQPRKIEHVAVSTGVQMDAAVGSLCHRKISGAFGPTAKLVGFTFLVCPVRNFE